MPSTGSEGGISSPVRGADGRVFSVSVTFLMGLGVVLVSAAITYPMLFGRRPEPATVPVSGRRYPSARPAPPVERASHDVRIAWWQRLRSALALIVVVAAIAGAIAVVLGVIVLGIGLLLQG